MKKRRVLILVLMAAVVAAAIVVINLRSPDQPSSPPTPPRPPTPQPQPQASTPSEAVVAYLEALSNADFGAAYEYLSSESRAAHPYEEFAALCKESKGPSLDIGSAAEHRADSDRVTVTVSMLWDPAEASFTTVREDGAWRVVFIEGKPWFPYP
ncbi:MAG: DUF4878 domain-containing protein [Armatimonadota bacterium]|nr:MAG: DUF4878 domain-containing protein [Armatimonadota bacterium]